MGKKRKVRGRPSAGENTRNEVNDTAKRLINHFEDVADSEDEFHVNGDKILLDEGPAQKKRRREQAEDRLLEASDEEVLAESDGLSSSEGEFDDEEAEPKTSQQVIDKNRSQKPLQNSDDEEDAAAPVEDDEAGGWGTSKKVYYDADVIETEADALEEEAEAMRLQKKQLQDMTEADFGFDAADWLEADQDAEGYQEDGVVRRQTLPKLEITDSMGTEERLKLMQTKYPEFEPLAKEFLHLQIVHQELGAAEEAARAVSHDPHLSIPGTVLSLKHRALGAYLGSVSMYFALLTSGAPSSDAKGSAMPPEELRDHAVMDILVQSRDLWERIKDIPLTEVSSPSQEAGTASDQAVHGVEGEVKHSRLQADRSTNGSLPISSNGHTSKHQKKRLRKAERLALAAQEEGAARRAERLRQTEMSFKSLPDFTQTTIQKSLPSRRSPVKGSNHDNDSDFGDATSLTAHEAAEKAKRKKSLKFYTSQIAQKSNRRDGAGRDAGGDADVPYRERLRDRQERLNAEAERRGQKQKVSSAGAALGSGLDDDGGDESTNAERRRNGNVSGSDNEYYDLIAKQTMEKKASKAANKAQAHTQIVDRSTSALNLNEAGVDAEGKRAITYAIEKNKGLHPHRKKDVRNPRVKKRKKFEEKKKKLSSVRAVYKNDREGKGGYGGEKTGIKMGLVRSVKL